MRGWRWDAARRHGEGGRGQTARPIPEAIREGCVSESSGNPFEGEEPVTAVAGHQGATAGFFCNWEPASGGAGSVSLTYLLFPDRSTMYDDYWKSWVWDTRFGIDCGGKRPSEFAFLQDGARAGRVFCTGGQFQPEMTWTDDHTLVLTNAMQIPFSDIGAAELYTWWLDWQQGEVVLHVSLPPSHLSARTAFVGTRVPGPGCLTPSRAASTGRPCAAAAGT